MLSYVEGVVVNKLINEVSEEILDRYCTDNAIQDDIETTIRRLDEDVLANTNHPRFERGKDMRDKAVSGTIVEVEECKENILHRIDSCSGEIRIIGARYDRGWYCLIQMLEESPSCWEIFEDLVGGDNDYAAAKRYFEKNKSSTTMLSLGDTPLQALSNALVEMTLIVLAEKQECKKKI